MEADEIGGDLAHRVERGSRGLARFADPCQRREEGRRAAALGPAQLEAAADLADLALRGQAQLARGVVAAGRELLPRRQAARLLQADGEHVAREVDQLRRAERRAEELHAGLGELVRLVEDRDLDARQQLRHAAVAQRHVGEEQVMVDDDEVGEHRLAPRLHHVALAVLRAFAAEAVLARRGDQRDDAAALVEAVELGEVAARRRLRPGLDLRERAHREAIGQVRVLARAAEPVQAQVARAALEQRHRHRQLERVAQARQVAHEELVLERLGGGAEQRSRAAEERGHEVGEGLADAGSGLDDERLAVLDRGGDGERHVALDRALGVVRIDRRERAVGAEGARSTASCRSLGEGCGARPPGQHQQAFALRAAVFAAAAARRLMPAAAVRARTRCA